MHQLDQVPRDGKTKTRTGLIQGVIGAPEFGTQVRQLLGTHPDPGIGDAEGYTVASAERLDLNRPTVGGLRISVA